jgi:hypothetical protein
MPKPMRGCPMMTLVAPALMPLFLWLLGEVTLFSLF